MEKPSHPSERNQRAKIRLSPIEIANLLDLPPGMRAVHVFVQQDPTSVYVVVEGEALEPQPHDVELPVLNGWSESKSIIGPDGERYVRWGWQR